MRKKRFAYICADAGIPVFGAKGCSVHVQEFLRAAVQHEFEIDLIAANLNGTIPPDLTGLRLYQLDQLSDGSRADREKAAISTNAQTLRALKKIGPVDFIYERYSLWSYAGMQWAHTKGIPGLLEVNAPLIEEQSKYRGIVDNKTAHEIAAKTFSMAWRIIAVSKELAEYVASFASIGHPVCVIPNGINPTRFPRTAQTTSGPSAGFTVGFLGSLKPWHGLQNLTEAFNFLHQSHPNVRLLIVGDGPERSKLEAELPSTGHVELAGMVDPSAVPRFLARMNVGMAPYSLQDNFYFSPMKIFEYMAAGLPVVASSIGQIKDIIEDDVTGVLCPPDDTFALSMAIRRLMESPGLCKKIGQAARLHVFRYYTWNNIFDRVLRLLQPAKPLSSYDNTIQISH